MLAGIIAKIQPAKLPANLCTHGAKNAAKNGAIGISAIVKSNEGGKFTSYNKNESLLIT